MKKIFTILLSAMMILFHSGCFLKSEIDNQEAIVKDVIGAYSSVAKYYSENGRTPTSIKDTGYNSQYDGVELSIEAKGRGFIVIGEMDGERYSIDTNKNLTDKNGNPVQSKLLKQAPDIMIGEF